MSDSEPYRRVVARLHSHGYNPVGTGERGLDCKAYCPAHDDTRGKHKSLTLSWKDGELKFHCWSHGCRATDIIKALGSSWDEIYEGCERPRFRPRVFHDKPRPGQPQKPERIVDKFTYAFWAEQVAKWQARRPSDRMKLQEFANSLGVTMDALIALHCGIRYHHANKAPWNTMHLMTGFRDGQGRTTGIHARWMDGRKQSQYRSHNTLFYADEVPNVRTGVILAVEGLTDTAAAWDMGLPCVGRASNKTNGEEIGELLGEACWDGVAEVLVLGENDARTLDNGLVDWPGRDGMLKVAQDTANRLGMPVKMAMPPDGAKDLRSWFLDQKPDLNNKEQLRRLGQIFIEKVLATAEEVKPVERSSLDKDIEEILRKSNSALSAAKYSPFQTYCHRCNAVQLRDKVFPDCKQIICQRCMTWSCAGCTYLLKERWMDRLATIMSKLMRNNSKVYVYRGRIKSWKTFSNNCLRTGTRYFKIRLETGKYWIAMTQPILEGATEIAPKEATQQGHDLIKSLEAATKGTISRCHEWKEQSEEVVSGRWEIDCNLGRVRRDRIALMLRERDVECLSEVLHEDDNRVLSRIYYRIPSHWNTEQEVGLQLDLMTLGDHSDTKRYKRAAEREREWKSTA